MSLPVLPAEKIAAALRLHPRVAYQGLLGERRERERLIARLPAIVPFRKPYLGVISILDWDHRLPSRKLALRVFAYHDETALLAGQAAFDDRLEDIGDRDRFPEFDVPDFADLPADEAYEAEVELDGSIVGCRLTSSWRRDVPTQAARDAVRVVRASPQFAEVAEASKDRPRHLGDLEAVSWTPPCESGYPHWTLDVWYLTAFDGRIGSGRSLLVDLEAQRVITVREFAVRAG